MSAIHVIPLGDLREHEESDTCWCHPDPILEGHTDLWVHHAADGREDYETGARTPS